jgi:Phosphotransferase enzyme family
MVFLLSSQNIFEHLVKEKICNQEDQYLSNTELKKAKNFNLLLSLHNGNKFLVKQERHNCQRKAVGEFLSEWRIHKFLQHFPELSYLKTYVSELLHFDVNNSILVFKYLDNYRDLADLYIKENYFPSNIAASIGKILAVIHQNTFNCKEYQDFFLQNSVNVNANPMKNLLKWLERVEPDIFGSVTTDGLRFFLLYQRYDSLGQTIAELANNFNPFCLTHNDLKLNNILVHNDWEKTNYSIIRLIDWERSSWGDPAFDLGTVIASYIQIWLSSLVISKSLSIEESLGLAITPLTKIQPSIASLTQAYFCSFPEILEHYPNFLSKVVQCAGFALIQQIQGMILFQKSFGNTGIAMLQVAKTLLCRPEESIPTVFGTHELLIMK